MRYIIDISQAQAKQIEALIEEKRYESLNQFVSVAIENQLHIEKIEISAQEDRTGTYSKPFITQKFHDARGFPEEEIEVDLAVPKGIPVLVAPPAFPELVPFRDDIAEEKCWLWGQINRIFPVKVALRVLIRDLNKITPKQWIEFESFKGKAADGALYLGKAINKYEAEKNKKRDGKISAGLPKSIEFTSLIRYKAHFIGTMRKDGKLDGAMPFLRFANLTKGDNGKVLIGITEAGYEFARLENPAIDLKNFEYSLGQAETDFYLDHVYKNVKSEFNAIKWLLNKMVSGVSDRSALNNEIKREFGGSWNVSDAVINTQRAGLMSRMSELGLIDKEKEGIQVRYLISERGKKFLEKYER
jgi:hypothetical protein